VGAEACRKIGRGKRCAVELHFQQAQRAAVAAGGEAAGTVYIEGRGKRRARTRFEPGAQNPQRAALEPGEGARIGGGDAAHQVVDARGRQAPVDAPVFRLAPTAIIAAGEVLRLARRGALEQRGQAAVQRDFGGHRHFAEDVERSVIGQYRDRQLIDDVAGVRFFGHVVQSGAGFGLAVDHRPIHGHAPAVLRQQRAVHVERAACRAGEQRRRQHMPVIERKQEIRPQRAYPVHDGGGVRIIRRDGVQAVVGGESGDAVEPDFLAGLSSCVTTSGTSTRWRAEPKDI